MGVFPQGGVVHRGWAWGSWGAGLPPSLLSRGCHRGIRRAAEGVVMADRWHEGRRFTATVPLAAPPRWGDPSPGGVGDRPAGAGADRHGRPVGLPHRRSAARRGPRHRRTSHRGVPPGGLSHPTDRDHGRACRRWPAGPRSRHTERSAGTARCRRDRCPGCSRRQPGRCGGDRPARRWGCPGRAATAEWLLRECRYAWPTRPPSPSVRPGARVDLLAVPPAGRTEARRRAAAARRPGPGARRLATGDRRRDRLRALTWPIRPGRGARSAGQPEGSRFSDRRTRMSADYQRQRGRWRWRWRWRE